MKVERRGELVARNVSSNQLQALVDKQEIHELLMRYCRGVDRCDRDLIAATYHPDATVDHGFFRASGADAPDIILELVRHSSGGGMHMIGNELVELDGNTAYCESYFITFESFESGSSVSTYLRGARYVDRMERRNGEWKIANRAVVHEVGRFDPVQESAPPLRSESQLPRGLIEGIRRVGLKSKDDPVYRLRQGDVD